MNNQLKAGDLALIVGAFRLTENIGKVVELVQLVVEGETYTAPNGERYEHDDVPCWVVTGCAVAVWSEAGVFEGFGLCAPQHLMPLRGELAPAQRKAEEVTQ